MKHFAPLLLWHFMPLLLWLAFGSGVPAQDDGPVIAVQAPTSVTSGQIVWIKTEGTIADDLAWRSQAPSHCWNLADDKRSAMFQTIDGDRDYMFAIAACRNNKIDIRFFVIKVTGGRTPTPNPPQPGPDDPSPGPTPNTDFSRTVKRLAEENLPQSERSRCRSLSESIESLCSRMMATPSEWSPRSARESFRRNNATALGAAAAQPLDGSRGDLGLEGDRFGIFPGQMGHQALDVNAEIIPGVFVLGAGLEASEKTTQIGSNSADIHRIHYGVLREGKLHERRILHHFQHSGQCRFIALQY